MHYFTLKLLVGFFSDINDRRFVWPRRYCRYAVRFVYTRFFQGIFFIYCPNCNLMGFFFKKIDNPFSFHNFYLLILGFCLFILITIIIITIKLVNKKMHYFTLKNMIYVSRKADVSYVAAGA